MEERVLWLALALVVGGVVLATTVDVIVGVLLIFWAVWAVLVERQVGLRAFLAYDPRSRGQLDPAELRRWLIGATVAIVLLAVAAVAFDVGPALFLAVLAAAVAVFTAWVIRLMRA